MVKVTPKSKAKAKDKGKTMVGVQKTEEKKKVKMVKSLFNSRLRAGPTIFEPLPSEKSAKPLRAKSFKSYQMMSNKKSRWRPTSSYLKKMNNHAFYVCLNLRVEFA